MNTLKRLYAMSNTYLDISPARIHYLAQAYVSAIAPNTSSKAKSGSVTNIFDIFKCENISWNRLLTYFRIINGHTITVSIIMPDGILTATDNIYFPLNTTRINTDTHRDGEILRSLTKTYGLTNVELERAIRTNLHRVYHITKNTPVSSKVTNLYTALTRKTISFPMFLNYLSVCGVTTAIITITVAHAHGTIEVTTKLLELEMRDYDN